MNIPQSRREFLTQNAMGVGGIALAWLLKQDQLLARPANIVTGPRVFDLTTKQPHFAPRANAMISLFMHGGPSHMDLMDPKPELTKYSGTEYSGDVTYSFVNRASKTLMGSPWKFEPRGQCGTELSELLPHLADVVDDICVVRSMHTGFNGHEVSIRYWHGGIPSVLGRPTLGAWITYALGAESQDLPAYVVLISQGTGRPGGQPLFSRLWSSGFLPSRHQGVKFRSAGDPVLYLSNPPGLDGATRRATLDALSELNQLKAETFADPEIETRIAQYEMAYRMQTSVPQLMDLGDESEHTFARYGPNSRQPGTYAANCLLARRLAERGVRFIQLFHRGWDQHGDLPNGLRGQCDDVDQPSAALIRDLEERGMLDDTLIVWGGEFGRTVYCQGALQADNYGRDHHGRCFSIWLAGGGIRGGIEYGQTDDYCYNIAEDPVHIHDLNATILHCLGIDHRLLTYKFQGLDQRLTGVEEARVIEQVLA